MAMAIGNFALRQFGMGWITAPDQMGHLAYTGVSMAASIPLNFFVQEASKGMFPEKAAEEENSSFLSKLGVKPIKTMDDLTEKIFWVAVSIALIIPVTLFAKEAVIYLGYQHLSMLTTPLLVLFKEEVIDILISQMFLLILSLSLDSSAKMA